MLIKHVAVEIVVGAETHQDHVIVIILHIQVAEEQFVLGVLLRLLVIHGKLMALTVGGYQQMTS